MGAYDMRAGQHDVWPDQKLSAVACARSQPTTAPGPKSAAIGASAYHLSTTFRLAAAVPSTKIIPVLPLMFTPNSTETSLAAAVAFRNCSTACSASSATMFMPSDQAIAALSAAP